MWSETEVLTPVKKQSTVIKESYPLLTTRRHGLKIASLWKNTLSRPPNAFHIQSVLLKFVPFLLALRIMITLQFRNCANPTQTVFHLILKAETSLSTVSCLNPNKSYFHVEPLSNALLGTTFSLNSGFLATVTKTKMRPCEISLQQNLRQSLFVLHQGIIPCTGLHRPSLNEY